MLRISLAMLAVILALPAAALADEPPAAAAPLAEPATEAAAPEKAAPPATPPLLHPRMTAEAPARTVPTAEPPPPRRLA